MMLSVRCPVRAPASRPRAATVSAPKPCKALRAVVVRATDDKNPLSNVGDALKNAAKDAGDAANKLGDKIAEGAESVKETAGQAAESVTYDNKQAQREQLYGSSNAGAEEKAGGAAGKHTSRSASDPKQQTGGGP